jgi:adenylate cyclase
VHLNVLEQILQQRFLTRPESMKSAEIIAVLTAGLLMILLAPFINSLILALICVGIVVTFNVGALWSYIEIGVLVDPLYSSLCVVLLFFASVLFSYIRAESERQSVRNAFGLYISPDFMKELTKSPDKLTLGGEIRDLTVLFSDIRNFTTISEQMSPEVLINTMNDFLTPMSDEVMRYRGTIDKYMGDAMMAFFNAPLDDDAHPRHACEAALAMVEVLGPVNEAVKAKAEEEGRPFHRLNAGIGINTGPCAVGNMGSRTRFAYSALGDAVNLASRLEGQTKNYGINILVGEDTVKHVPEFAWLELDLIRVKGKELPVRVYFLYGNEADANEVSFKKWQEHHNNFLENYRLQNFDIALKILDKCRTLDTEGVLEICYDLYELRIEAFKVNPPPREWDGVYVATSK